MSRRALRQCLEDAFSENRLGAYRSKTDHEDEPCEVYLWNMELCEALYPALNAAEVGVRNELDKAISSYRDNNWWFSDGELLGEQEFGTYDKVKARLQDDDHPIEHPQRGHYVADLSFGFWTGLLHSFYEKNQRLWPTLLTEDSCYTPFAGAPKTLQNRQDFFKRVNSIRKLRNRVFHHEPVWNRDTLDKDYKTILEVIGWVKPELKNVFEEFCRFPEVYEGNRCSDRVRRVTETFTEDDVT